MNSLRSASYHPLVTLPRNLSLTTCQDVLAITTSPSSFLAGHPETRNRRTTFCVSSLWVIRQQWQMGNQIATVNIQRRDWQLQANSPLSQPFFRYKVVLVQHFLHSKFGSCLLTWSKHYWHIEERHLCPSMQRVIASQI